MQSMASEMYKSYQKKVEKKGAKQQQQPTQTTQTYQKQPSQSGSKFPVQTQQTQMQEKEIYDALFESITTQAAPSQLYQQLGLQVSQLSNVSLSSVDLEGTVNFFPPKKRGENYLKFCCNGNRQPITSKDIVNVVQQYTRQETKYCTKINLLLAADSSEIASHGEYIKNLKWCIAKLANKFPVKVKECFRGMQCSEQEFNSYERDKTLFIPSFLSTSKNPEKFYQGPTQNTLVVVKLKYIPANACVINSQYSAYASVEEEVLFSCYSKFKVVKKEKNKVFNGKNYDFYIELLHLNDFFVSK